MRKAPIDSAPRFDFRFTAFAKYSLRTGGQSELLSISTGSSTVRPGPNPKPSQAAFADVRDRQVCGPSRPSVLSSQNDSAKAKSSTSRLSLVVFTHATRAKLAHRSVEASLTANSDVCHGITH